MLLLVPAYIHLPRFYTVNNNLQVNGYQLYAVEKWIVERNRPVTVLLVYTGDPSHKVSCYALSPLPELSPADAQAEWDKALLLLRRDGARPKQTPNGVLMATSLAHFRSDYTIVLIPDGNFLAVREQLYANINLLRMGCSGRSALTLEDPSDATKSRFISTYHFPESICSHAGQITSTDSLAPPMALTKTRSHSHTYSHSTSVVDFAKYSPENPTSTPSSLSKTKFPIGQGLPSSFGSELRPSLSKEKQKVDNSTFIATVLELVKLVQAGLTLFGMYGANARLDGLLCDETVEGIRKWILTIGGPCIGLEPMERIADPTFVAALISLVFTIRNKLAALGFSQLVPKDPFLHPQLFTCALTAYVQSTASPSTTHQDLAFLSHHTPANATGFGYASGGTYLFPPSLHYQHAPQITPSNSHSNSSSSGSNAHLPAPAPPPVLTRELVDAIASAYDAKVGATDGRVGGGRVRRKIREKLRAGVVDRESDSDAYGGGEQTRGGATSGGEGGGIGIVGGEREKDRERELGGVGTGVASSGGQILSGIGSFASGLGIAVGPGGSGVTGAGAVMDATYDLAWLVRCIYSKDGKGKTRIGMGIGKGKDRRGDDGSIGYGYSGKEKEKDGGVGLSVRALWSGQVNSIIKLREWEVEKEKMSGTVADGKRRADRDRLALSDGDVDDTPGTLAKSETEEESDPAIQPGSFRGMWGERMQKKLGSWTGLSKRRGHMSLDLTSSPSRGENAGGTPNIVDALATARPDMSRGQSMPISPTLPPIVFSGGEGDPDDDDLLSSGQVSPVDNLRPSPFTLLHDGHSLESTSLANTEYERKVTEFNQKRPWVNRIPQHRVFSWADPLSARGLLDDDGSDLEGSTRRRRRGNTIGSLLGTASVLSEVASEEWLEFEDVELSSLRRRLTPGPERRRSFHDLDSLRGMRVIPVERMRVDVELSGQLLILTRREQHLQNVIACLQVLTSTLSDTSTHLRADHASHIPFLSELDAHAHVISDIDTANAKTDKMSQATNTLRYEAEQFRVPGLWHTAMPPRQKVLELREKVFGTGGRRLPPGVHGAYGKYNRLQWTLDGRERLVDHLGRTESEAEEEEAGMPYLGRQDEDDDEDVVQHPGIKPMWLLRFFTSWGARWGAPASATSPVEDGTKGTPEIATTVKGKTTAHNIGANGAGIKKLTFDLPDVDESSSPL